MKIQRIAAFAVILAVQVAAIFFWRGDERAAQVPQSPSGQGMIMPGEARVLAGTAPVKLLHPVDKLLSLYGYDADGALVTFAAGKDYTLARGNLARTQGSAIPDFAGHRVKRDGRGRFVYSPAPRSPQLAMPFTVYARYEIPNAGPRYIDPAGDIRSKRVACLGDSITAGAHTVALEHFDNRSGAYCALLERNLGGDRQFINRGVGGAFIDMLDEKFDAVVPRNIDAAIIAFGMNDHVRGEPALKGFKEALSRNVVRFEERGIDAVLIGFFQQNPDWNKEDPEMTRAYNAAICEIAARHDVPFVDIEAYFQAAMPAENMRAAHLTGDFIHHPNEFGQRLYMSAILPYFLKRPQPMSAYPDYVPLTLPARRNGCSR